MVRSRLASLGKRFARTEDGSVTIEAVLWFPAFVWLMLVIADASLAFFAKAEAFRIIQDGNRLFSTKTIENMEDVEGWVLGEVWDFSRNATATTKLNPDETIVFTELSIPVEDVVLFNSLGIPENWVINVRSQHYVEVK